MLISLSVAFPLAFMVTAAWAFGADAPGPGAPIPGYGIFTPRWVVPSPDGSGETLSLSGTVEEVAAQLRDMDPSFDVDEEFGKIATPAIGRRAAFADDARTLCHNFREGNRTAVHVGIDYLRTVQGRPQNGAGPANCGRVSCRNNTGIWWCNDAPKPKELESFGNIADGAQRVLEKCQDKLDANQGEFMTVSGQAFHEDGWNVVVRGGDDCSNAGVNINSRGLGGGLRGLRGTRAAWGAVTSFGVNGRPVSACWLPLPCLYFITQPLLLSVAGKDSPVMSDATAYARNPGWTTECLMQNTRRPRVRVSI